MRDSVIAIALCCGLAAASCAADEPILEEVSATTTPEATTSTSATSPERSPQPPAEPPSTSTSTPTTSTATILAFTPSSPYVPPEPTLTGGGSGCAPGSGPLPDGVWFGFIEGLTSDTVAFDLACYLACDPGDGFRVGNVSERIRAVPVDDEALAVFAAPDADLHEPYQGILGYEELNLHTETWLYVNDGAITHLVFPRTTRGCSSPGMVEVRWIAELPPGIGVAFNDEGLAVASQDGAVFYRHEGDAFAPGVELHGFPVGGFGSGVSGEVGTIGVGDVVHRSFGGGWWSESFTRLGDGVAVLDVAEDHALLSGMRGDDVVVHVLSWVEAGGWTVDTIELGRTGEWETWAGSISGQWFAVADTGLHTAGGEGTVHLYRLRGTEWTREATLHDQWDTGMWGSWLDLSGDRLLVAADGTTPGGGSPGGIYLYTRDEGTTEWTPTVIGEGGDGFGLGASLDWLDVVAAASNSDETASFWVFTSIDERWHGTPIQLDLDDPMDDWVHGIDVLGGFVAVATHEGVFVGEIVRTVP